MLKKHELNAEELVDVIERDYEDESVQSNYWENLYNLDHLKELLGESMIVIGNMAFLHLKDGFYEVNFRTEESPMLEVVQLFSLEDLLRTSMKTIKNEIEQRQREISQLERIGSLLQN